MGLSFISSLVTTSPCYYHDEEEKTIKTLCWIQKRKQLKDSRIHQSEIMINVKWNRPYNFDPFVHNVRL